MLRRFFSDSPIVASAPVVLCDTEAHHLLHVLRAQPGDRVELFDGHGSAFEAEVARIDRKQVTLQVRSESTIDRELPVPLTLAVALPRGDRQDWLVQKAVEVGVTTLVPLTTERGVAQPNAKTVQRMSRAVIEASKQCRRNRLMRIETPVSAHDYVSQVVPSGTTLAIFAHLSPQGVALHRLYTDFARTALPAADGGNNGLVDVEVHVAIGPEGGFTDDEAALAAQQRWAFTQLGNTVLRTETAAIVAAAHLALLMGTSNR